MSHMKRPPLRQMPPVTPIKLSHIVLRSANVTAAKDWYVKALNARIVFEGEGGAGYGLSFDSEHHRIAIIGMPPADIAAQEAIGDIYAQVDRRRSMSGLEHVAFTFDGVGVWLAQYTRLKALGIEPVMCVNHGPVLSLYYLDPDGNNVELQTDTMPMDQATEFMFTDAFAENSIGAPFDPDELCARYEAGESLSSIVKSGWEGVF